MIGDTTPVDRLISGDPVAELAERLSYTVEAMIACARLALDNETSAPELRDRAGYVVEETLMVAQALARSVGEGIEAMDRAKR